MADQTIQIDTNAQHEYAFITTTAGHRAQVHYRQEEMQEVAKAFGQFGQGAFVILTDVDTGDRYVFPGNVDVLHTFSQERFDQMQAEAKAAEEERRKLTSRSGSPLIRPSSANGARIM